MINGRMIAKSIMAQPQLVAVLPKISSFEIPRLQ